MKKLLLSRTRPSSSSAFILCGLRIVHSPFIKWFCNVHHHVRIVPTRFSLGVHFMTRFIAAVLLALATTSVFAQSPDIYRQAFDAIQQAVAEGDASAFADWVSYPIEVVADGEPLVIGDAAEFPEHYDGIVTPEIAEAVSNQSFNDLFVNAEGAMFGDGQVW